MAKSQQRKSDSVCAQIEEALDAYTQLHHGATYQVKRQNSVAVRIRVMDPGFRGIDRVRREDRVWEFLDKLPENVRSQITFVLLLAPMEQRGSLLNKEFERPSRSRI